MEIIGYEGNPNPDCPLTWGATAILDGDEIINGTLGTRSEAGKTLAECRDSICFLRDALVVNEVWGIICPLYDDIVRQVVLQVAVPDDSVRYINIVGYDENGEPAHRCYVLAKDSDAFKAWVAKATEKLDEYIAMLNRAYDILDHRRSTQRLLDNFKNKGA